MSIRFPRWPRICARSCARVGARSAVASSRPLAVLAQHRRWCNLRAVDACLSRRRLLSRPLVGSGKIKRRIRRPPAPTAPTSTVGWTTSTSTKAASGTLNSSAGSPATARCPQQCAVAPPWSGCCRSNSDSGPVGHAHQRRSHPGNRVGRACLRPLTSVQTATAQAGRLA